MKQKSMSQLIQFREKLKKEGKVIPGIFDEMFKQIMKGCPKYLADLLYQIIGLDPTVTLENMIVQDTNHVISHILEKRKRSDVIIQVENHIINLEMNEEFYRGLYEKNEAYMRRLGSEMIQIGEDYDDKKFIQINFDYFTPFDERLVVEFRIMDVERHIVEVENYVKYHINLAKVVEKYYNESEKDHLSKLEKELLILVLDDKNEIKEISKGDVELMEVGKKIEDLSFDINMIGLYDVEEDRRITDYLKTKYKLEKAEEEGLQRGMEKGIEKGMEKGIEQGEKNKCLEIAREMLKEGLEPSLISKITSLSSSELEKLL